MRDFTCSHFVFVTTHSGHIRRQTTDDVISWQQANFAMQRLTKNRMRTVSYRPPAETANPDRGRHLSYLCHQWPCSIGCLTVAQKDGEVDADNVAVCNNWGIDIYAPKTIKCETSVCPDAYWGCNNCGDVFFDAVNDVISCSSAAIDSDDCKHESMKRVNHGRPRLLRLIVFNASIVWTSGSRMSLSVKRRH